MNCVENLEGEIWKDVDGCPDYRISNKGRVMSVKFGKELILKQRKDKDGYLRVGLCCKGKQKTIHTHRLVAIAFLENPLNLPQVNHKNEIKDDNRACNLEFCSAKYNVNYKGCLDRRKKSIKNSIAFKEANRIRGEKRAKQVFQYTSDGTLTLINVYKSVMQAERETNYSSRNISACCRANINLSCTTKYKTAFGYIWSYTPIETEKKLN